MSKILLLALVLVCLIGLVLGAVNLCLLPIEEGHCRALIHRWAYDKDQDKCIQFNYGGCGGNDNRFESLADCQKQCRRPVVHAPEPWVSV